MATKQAPITTPEVNAFGMVHATATATTTPIPTNAVNGTQFDRRNARWSARVCARTHEPARAAPASSRLRRWLLRRSSDFIRAVSTIRCRCTRRLAAERSRPVFRLPPREHFGKVHAWTHLEPARDAESANRHPEFSTAQPPGLSQRGASWPTFRFWPAPLVPGRPRIAPLARPGRPRRHPTPQPPACVEVPG